MGRKQKELPGMESPKFPEVDAAAEGYVDARDKRMKLSAKEKVAKTALIAAMRKAKVEIYRDATSSPPLLVTLTTQDGVVVEEQGQKDDDEAEQ